MDLYLNFFEVKCDFAIFAVKRSGLAFAFIVTVFLAEQDECLTCVTFNTFKLTATFMLTLEKQNTVICK